MAPQNALQIAGVLSVLLLIQGGHAFEFRVGGSRSSWTVPTDPDASIYNQWAEKNRFQIGDTLLFVYDGSHDSVLRVSKEDYDNCNTASPQNKFSDGHTVFKLTDSGPYYFISGVAENCRKNEKLVVVVMADRTKREAAPPPPSEDETPSEEGSPPNYNGAVSSAAAAVAAVALLGFSVVFVI